MTNDDYSRVLMTSARMLNEADDNQDQQIASAAAHLRAAANQLSSGNDHLVPLILGMTSLAAIRSEEIRLRVVKQIETRTVDPL